MSAYASLPGSLLPFFAFGAPSGPSGEDGCEPSKDGVDTEVADEPNGAQPYDAPSLSSSSSSRPPKDDGVSAFKALALSSSGSDTSSTVKSSQCPSPPSQPSDIVIAFQSARVDPVQLIKSLTSSGSSIARRTANFISRTPDNISVDVDNSVGSEAASAGQDAEQKDYSPGLCFEDSDSDDEYSMYDYSDDFSTPDNGYDDEEDEQQQRSSSDGDPSAIEFELSITFQGRKYNATRSFPTFVKLREDLLQELSSNKDRRSRRCRRSESPNNLTYCEAVKLSPALDLKGDSTNEGISVPELPRVSPESLTGHGGCALSGVARSGFALLQATAMHYCPEMELWMRQIIDSFPCSQVLSSFLWEPLSSTNAGWESIGEEGNEMSDSCHSSLLDSSSSAKPQPPSSQGKSKSRNFSGKSSSSSLGSRYKSRGSFGSLSSIGEAENEACHDFDDW